MLGRIASIALALLALSSVAAAEPLRVRVSWTAPVSDWASIWLEKKDLAKHLGKSYVLESTRFAGIVEIAIVGYALIKAMAAIRRRLLLWHHEAQAPA